MAAETETEKMKIFLEMLDEMEALKKDMKTKRRTDDDEN